MPPAVWDLCGMRAALTAAGHQVITFASHGVAPSDAPPPPYRIEGMSSDVAALIETVVNQPCSVVGYSLGGFITEALCRTRPDLVSRAVLLASAGPLTATLRATLETEEALIAEFGHLPDAFTRFETLRTSLPPRVLRDDQEQVTLWWRLVGAQASCWSSPDGERGQSTAAFAWAHDESRMHRLRDIAQSVLVAAFEHDLYFPPWAGRVAAEQLPAARFVEISDAAHGGLMTHPQACISEVLTFLTGS